MKIGPKQIYKCPKCNHQTFKYSLISGNTIDADYFSDGKMVAPMLHEFPSITKCPKCETIYWLNEENYVDDEDLYTDEKTKNPNTTKANFLTLYDYLSALISELCSSVAIESYFRRMIWWGFNDRVRDGHPIFSRKGDGETWKKNLNALISLLEPIDKDHRIMIAELYRNLGSFEKCKEKLSEIKDPEMNDIIASLIRECDNRNPNVIRFDY